MSEYKWSICPRCKKIQEEKINKLIKETDNSYGKIPAEEYLQLIKEKDNPEKLGKTLSENCSATLDESGYFEIHYEAECDVCEYRFTYDFEKQIENFDVESIENEDQVNYRRNYRKRFF